MLVFCADTELTALHSSEYLMCDGTFEMVPGYVYQVYTFPMNKSMHGFIREKGVQLLWVILPNKTRHVQQTVQGTEDGPDGLSLWAAHRFPSSPIVHTHRVLPCMVQSRLRAVPRQRKQLYLLPASRASIFNPLVHRELHSCCSHQCLHRPECTSSQVRCVPSQPDRLVTQSIATILLSQGEPTV